MSRRIFKSVFRVIVKLLIVVAIFLLLRYFVFMLVRIEGSSMEDTVYDSDYVFCTIYDAKFGTVDRNDVVLCNFPGRSDELFIERLVAIPGDRVYRENGTTHIIYTIVNEKGETEEIDEALDDSEVDADYDYEPYTLGEDEYFVVGDNRSNSHDSRCWKANYSDDYNVGPITRKMIVGHVRFAMDRLTHKIRTIK